MTVIVESKRMKITKGLRQFAQKQASKLSRLEKGISKISIYLENVANKRRDMAANLVTYSVFMPGKHIVVKKKATDMYEAISEATSAAMRKVRKSCEKRFKIKRQVKKIRDQLTA
jgi:ribosomal subunit interface protein